jgi:hypothetical protein
MPRPDQPLVDKPLPRARKHYIPLQHYFQIATDFFTSKFQPHLSLNVSSAAQLLLCGYPSPVASIFFSETDNPFVVEQMKHQNQFNVS